MPPTAGYRPGFRAGGPGVADQQRAAKRASSEPPPSGDFLRARAELREQMAKGRSSSAAFAPSPDASGDDEAEDANTRVVQVGKISAQFVLPDRPEEKPLEIGAALPHALKKQRKRAEQERKKVPASGTAAVLQAQADRLLADRLLELEQPSLEARALAGQFAEGRRGLWDRPDPEYAHVANATRVPTSGAALGRIVGQVQTHNRRLQSDDMWRRHKEGTQLEEAAGSGEAEEREPPAGRDRAAEILAAREEAAQRKLSARAVSEAEAAAAPAPPAVWASDDDEAGRLREKREKRGRDEKGKKHKKDKSKKEKKEKRAKKAKKHKRDDGHEQKKVTRVHKDNTVVERRKAASQEGASDSASDSSVG